MIHVRFDDSQVAEAARSISRMGADLRPLARAIGEHLTETTKQRFKSAEGPDGQRWAPNTQATIEAYLGNYRSSTTKTGRLSKAGAGRAMAKKPLTGETRSLSTTIAYEADSRQVSIGSAMIYSAVHQFGARRGEFGTTARGHRIPWGDIPARPYLGLSDADRSDVLQIVQEFIEDLGRR